MMLDKGRKAIELLMNKLEMERGPTTASFGIVPRMGHRINKFGDTSKF